MNRPSEKIRGAMLAVGAAALLTLQMATNARVVRAEEIDSVVASVDGEPITSTDLKNPNAAGGPGGMPASGISMGTPESPQGPLKTAIEQKLLEVEASKYASKVDDDEIDRYIANLEQQNHVTDDQLRAQLRTQNISYDDFRAKIRRQVEAMTMIDREVRQKIVIPEREIEIYYKDNPDEFTTSAEKFKLAQILIAVPVNPTPQQLADLRKKADEVHAKAVKSGADFAALALEYSDDDSKTKGGELGEFAPDDLNDAVLAAIKNSKTGDISPVVKTKYGFHIVKVEAHLTPGLQPLDQVRGKIRETLMTEQAKEAFQKWLDNDLVKRHYVETLPQ
ncbi:MAG TPA: peptidylprolyl isomerase [Candidatus Binataceae bacterium]